jgi:hypothetical protein
MAPKTQQPFICLFNGEALLRADWDRKIGDGDTVAFVTLPQGGGGGSNPLKIVLMIAVSVVAPMVAGPIAGSLGMATSGFGFQILSGAIGFVGKMLVNALIPEPKPPSAHQSAGINSQSASPTYSLSAQGNKARIGEPIPVMYGRHVIFPDFAAEPYTEYAGNEQYLYQLFAVGHGEYSIESIKIEDTPIGSFSEVQYAVYAPGQAVALFPANVTASAEVAGQEMLQSVAIGPFVINQAGTTANALAVDVVCPKGLFYANDDGGLDARSVTFTVQAQQVTDLGVPTGGWYTLGTHTITAATATAQRRSYSYSVASGRWQVKVTRTSAKDTSSRAGSEIQWVSCRAYMPGGNVYDSVTTLAIKMRATNNLSSTSSRKINVIATRKLPIWNGTTWSAPTATRSIAWALADILKSSYGGALADSRIDLAGLLALDSTWSSRADYFDAVFDSRQSIWEALTIVARAGRAKPYMQGGIVRFSRDGAVSVPVALFNKRNIVKGSLKIDYLIPNDETVDAIEVAYLDSTTWTTKTVSSQLSGETADRPAKVQAFGITNRNQAWREGMYMAAANRYRRQSITFSTDMEGFIPSFGDLIAIAHDRPLWGTSGEVTAYNAGTKTLTLSEPVEFVSGTYYVGLRKRDGSFSGPWEVTAGATAFEVVHVDAALDFTPDVGSDREKTYFSFGKADTHRKLARVMSVKPRNVNTVEIVAINEDAAVHTADTGSTPADSGSWNLPARITRPVVTGVNVTLGGTASNPQLLINWQPAPDAEHYYVETSYDSRQTWTRAGNVATTNISVPAFRGTVYVRVAGVGIAVGDWSEWVGDPFLAPPPDPSTFLVSVQPDGTRQFTMSLPGSVPDFAGYRIRYRLGTGWTDYWSDLDAFHDGLITQTPFESNQLAAGEYTFAVKAFDYYGNESVNALFISADLGDPRLAGVIYNVLPHSQAWPGTKTNCFVEPENNILSASDSLTWATTTTWDDYDRWVKNPAASMTYEHTMIDLSASVPFTPLISAIADGTQTIEVNSSVDNVTWSGWAAPTGQITARYLKVRIAVAGAFPILYLLDIKLNGGAVSEEINDLNTASLTGGYRIGTGDIRLPLVKSYSVITQVQVSLQNVGAGWSWEIIDKNPASGPRIKIYNASNALADATIDAFVRGY